MITPIKLIIAIACATIFGLVCFVEGVEDVLLVRNAPVVTGHIISRVPIRQYSVPRVDFTIRIDGTETDVHARTQRYLLDTVPDTVKFHYTGDKLREVFLFEYEENPCWICLFCWAAALFLTFCLRSNQIRKMLGWETARSFEASAKQEPKPL